MNGRNRRTAGILGTIGLGVSLWGLSTCNYLSDSSYRLKLDDGKIVEVTAWNHNSFNHNSFNHNSFNHNSFIRVRIDPRTIIYDADGDFEPDVTQVRTLNGSFSTDNSPSQEERKIFNEAIKKAGLTQNAKD
jgi:hypothetical protein